MDEDTLRSLIGGESLPPNHALSSLPPLPQTPHHARRAYDDNEGEEEVPRPEPRSQRRRGGAREAPRTVNRLHGLDPGKLSDIGVLTPARLPRSTTLPSLPTSTDPFSSVQKHEAVYPTLSTRQSSLNTARISPIKTDFLSPVRQPSALLHPSSAAKQHAASSIRPTRIASTSFMLPNSGDVSMLQDVTFGDLGRVSLGNDSVDMDFGREYQREWRTDKTAGDGFMSGARKCTSPEKLTVDTGYPRSPSKRSSRPPGQPGCQISAVPPAILDHTSSDRETSREDEKTEAISDSVLTTRDEPTTIKGDTQRQPGSVKRHKTKPSHSHLLAPPSTDHDGDVSTLLPVSPLKSRHLLSDEHMLTRTELHDESMLDVSLFIPPPTTPGRSRPEPAALPAQRPAAVSPAKPSMKTPRSMRKRPGMDKGDMTMDIQQMLEHAKEKKQNTGMGIEESFVDLLRADLLEDEFNVSLNDDSFLPLELRPGLVRSKSLSRLEVDKRRNDLSPSMSPSKLVTESATTPTRMTGKIRPNSFIERKDPADPSPVRYRAAVPLTGMPSKRVSLSAGNRPFPTSSSLQHLDLPLGRLSSTIRSKQDQQPPKIPATTLPRSSTITSMSRPATKGSMPPPAVPGVRSAQAPKTRTGSTNSLVSLAPRVSTLPRAPGVGTLSRPPTTIAPSSKSTTSSRPSMRPPAQTQPSTGTFSHATTAGMPRSFGTDAMGTSNRSSRPTTTASSKLPVKGSMGPPAAVSASRVRPPAGTTAKSRTLSTPASVVSKTSRPPTTSVAPLNRLSAAPAYTSRPAALPASRPTGVTAASRPAAQTTTGSRLPTTSSSSNVQRVATITKSSSTALAAAGLADIRARLDKLQARHQSAKTAR